MLDEADRILDMGFSASVNAIIANLPKSRQTLLFSATQTKSVKDLARLSLHDPEYVAVREGIVSVASKGKGKGAEEEEIASATPKNLEQHYMVVELDQKLDVLWSFIKTHLFTKTIVFLSSGKQVGVPAPCSALTPPGAIRVRELPSSASGRAPAAHARKAEADAASRDLPALRLGQALDHVCDRHCRARTRLSLCRLGRAGRLSRGRRDVHPSRGTDGAIREQGQGVDVPVSKRGGGHDEAPRDQEGRDL